MGSTAIIGKMYIPGAFHIFVGLLRAIKIISRDILRSHLSASVFRWQLSIFSSRFKLGEGLCRNWKMQELLYVLNNSCLLEWDVFTLGQRVKFGVGPFWNRASPSIIPKMNYLPTASLVSQKQVPYIVYDVVISLHQKEPLYAYLSSLLLV